MEAHTCNPRAGEAKTKESLWDLLNPQSCLIDETDPGSVKDPVSKNKVEIDCGQYLMSTTSGFHMCVQACTCTHTHTHIFKRQVQSKGYQIITQRANLVHYQSCEYNFYQNCTMPICLLQSVVKKTEKPAKLKIVTIWPFTGQKKYCLLIQRMADRI